MFEIASETDGAVVSLVKRSAKISDDLDLRGDLPKVEKKRSPRSLSDLPKLGRKTRTKTVYSYSYLPLRGTIVNRTDLWSTHLYIHLFLLTICGPINYGPP